MGSDQVKARAQRSYERWPFEVKNTFIEVSEEILPEAVLAWKLSSLIRRSAPRGSLGRTLHLCS